MNERIRELAEQAEKYALDNVGKGHYGIEDLIYQFQFIDTKIEKFAELIVKECADVIAPMGDWCGGHGEPSMPSTMECAKRLKQHFGVEE